MMRAIILAGGKGARLKPFTTIIPKPLVPIGGNKSIVEIIIQQLVKYGFTHITITVNHLANLIMAFLGDGKKWNVKIDYSLEDIPLSTIGPLTLINDLPENFLVINGDILCNVDFKDFYEYHVKHKNDITVISYKRKVKIDFGVLKYDDENKKLIEFIEKPTYWFDVTTGINCINRSIIEKLPKNKPYGFDNLMIDGINNRNKIEIKPFDGYWLDIGRPEDYDYVNENYEDIRKLIGID